MPGSLKVVDFSAAISAALTASVGEAVQETGNQMAETMRESMQASKSGANYGGHVASAPGESPANWHDVLLGTLKSEPDGPTSATVSAGGEEAPYEALYLEFGSPGGKVQPRPLVTPTAEEFKPIFIENITKAVKEVIG